MEQASNGVHLKFATLFSQKIHQTRVLLDILDGFDVHEINYNMKLKDKPSLIGSRVIYCIVINICISRPVNVTARIVQSIASYWVILLCSYFCKFTTFSLHILSLPAVPIT